MVDNHIKVQTWDWLVPEHFVELIESFAEAVEAWMAEDAPGILTRWHHVDVADLLGLRGFIGISRDYP